MALFWGGEPGRERRPNNQIMSVVGPFVEHWTHSLVDQVGVRIQGRSPNKHAPSLPVDLEVPSSPLAVTLQ